MTTAPGEPARRDPGRPRPSKVPEITAAFWVLKVLATTVGASAADYLDDTLGLGLTYTSYLMSGLLVVALAAQLGTRRYRPAVYWATLVLAGVVGTLAADELTGGLGVPLPLATAVLALLLATALVTSYAAVGTLAPDRVCTAGHEGSYWLTVLAALALGTALGDLVAERAGPARGLAEAVLVGLVALAVLARWRGHRPETAFWVAFVLTGPLGAPLADLATRSRDHGGLGLGATGAGVLFLGAIVLLVGGLSLTGRESTRSRGATSDRNR